LTRNRRNCCPDCRQTFTSLLAEVFKLRLAVSDDAFEVFNVELQSTEGRDGKQGVVGEMRHEALSEIDLILCEKTSIKVHTECHVDGRRERAELHKVLGAEGNEFIIIHKAKHPPIITLTTTITLLIYMYKYTNCFK